MEESDSQRIVRLTSLACAYVTVETPEGDQGNGPDNIDVLRRRALDVAQRDTSKNSLSIKLKRAGWDDDFPLSLLKQLPAA